MHKFSRHNGGLIWSNIWSNKALQPLEVTCSLNVMCNAIYTKISLTLFEVERHIGFLIISVMWLCG